MYVGHWSSTRPVVVLLRVVRIGPVVTLRISAVRIKMRLYVVARAAVRALRLLQHLASFDRRVLQRVLQVMFALWSHRSADVSLL